MLRSHGKTKLLLACIASTAASACLRGRPDPIVELRSGDRQRQYAAAKHFRQAPDPRAIPALIEVLGVKPPPLLGEAAAQALAATGTAATPALLEALRSPESYVRENAARAFGASRDPAAIPDLLKAVEDPHEGVRCCAVAALGHYRDPKLCDLFVRLMREGSPNVRLHAAWALDENKDPRLKDLLSDGLAREQYEFVRDHYRQILGRMRSEAGGRK